MKNDMQRMQDRHKSANDKSKVKVKEAYRQAEQDKYRKATKDGRKVSENLFDQEAVQSVKLEQLVAKLRKQFPELSDVELMDLAKMQMGIIDPSAPGKARPVQSTDTTRYPGVSQPRPPAPKPQGDATIHKIGGNTIAYPSHMAESAQRERDYESYMQQLEMDRAQFDAQQRQEEAAMKRQQQDLELRRLQKEFELDLLRMEQERKKLAAPQYGAISQVLMEGRQPVTNRKPTYLGD